jgi:hypothetical protein
MEFSEYRRIEARYRLDIGIHMMSWGEYNVTIYGESDCVRCREPEISPWQVSNGVDNQL